MPLHDDQKLFEQLTLEGAQAGLSWLTVLKRRDGYRQAFEGFNIEHVASFDEKKIVALLANPGIIRNKLKIRSTIMNAQAATMIQAEFGSLDSYLWQFVNYKPLQPAFKSTIELPAADSNAEQLSKDLRKRGMNFVGPTICYAFMQATGMSNDHLTYCFRYRELVN